MEKLIEVLIVLMAAAILIEMGILAGVLMSLRKISGDIERIRRNFDEKTAPVLAEIKEVAGQAKELLLTARQTAENFRSVSETVKLQVEKVNSTIEDTSQRARVQIAKIDDVVSDAVLRLEATSAIVQQNILAPIREVSALIRGVTSGFQILFSGRRNPINEAHQDEELFI